MLTDTQVEESINRAERTANRKRSIGALQMLLFGIIIPFILVMVAAAVFSHS